MSTGRTSRERGRIHRGLLSLTVIVTVGAVTVTVLKPDNVRLLRQWTVERQQELLSDRSLPPGSRPSRAHLDDWDVKATYPPAPTAIPAFVPIDPRGTGKTTSGTSAKTPSVEIRPDDVVARDLISAGDALFRKADFPGALGKYQETSRLKITAALTMEAETRSDRAKMLATLVRDLSADTSGEFSQVKVIHLKSGATMKGLILKDDSTGIQFKGDSGISGFLDRSSVDHVENVSASSLKHQAEEEIQTEGTQADPQDPLSLYRVAELAYRKGVPETGVPFLEKAYALEPNLVHAVRDGKARSLLVEGVWYEESDRQALARKRYREVIDTFPGTEAAQQAEVLLTGINRAATKPPATVATTGGTPPGHEAFPVPAPPSATTIKETSTLRQAEEAFAKAMAHYKLSRDGADKDKDKENRLAYEGFNQAFQLYLKVRDENPGSDEVEERLVKASMLRYGCFKSLRVT